jgi:tetratricopeptide (TPR) repeat protein
MRNPADVLERAELVEEKGNYQEAERLYNKALSLKVRETGDNSLELVPYIYNLGLSQFVNDKLEEAELSFQRLLGIMLVKQSELTREIEEVRNLLQDIKDEAAGNFELGETA